MTKNVLALALTSVVLSGCGEPMRCWTKDERQDPGNFRGFECVRQKLGGPFAIVVYASNDSLAARAAEAGFARVDALNAVLSDYDPDSEISKLSQRALDGPMREPVGVSEDLW